MTTEKNKTDVVIKFLNSSSVKEKNASLESIENSIKDLSQISKRLRVVQEEIKSCDSIESLEKIDQMTSISNELGIIMQNSVFITKDSFIWQKEEVNNLYRETVMLYFDKKMEILNKKVDETFHKTEDNIKEITGNTMFSIASVFLGLSLTSALVSGVNFLKEDTILIYFMTCLMIIVFTLGFASIFLRKFDKKSFAIIIIMILVSLMWGILFFNRPFQKENKNEDKTSVIQEANENIQQNVN